MTTTAGILMEETNPKRDLDIASKNVGSFVKINSISIDLADVKDKNYVGKCDHFSIRGYVSEVRSKNWKLCWPFPLDDELNKLKDQTSLLPPLTSPKFRHWSCKCCLKEIDCLGTKKDHATKLNSCSAAVSKSKSDCSATMNLPDVSQAPQTSIAEKKQNDVCTSSDVSSKKMCKDKKALVVTKTRTSFIGTENGFGNDAGHELPGVTSVPAEINLNVTQEKPEYETVTESRKLEETRAVDLCKHSRGKYDVTDVGGASKNPTKICIAENPIPVEEPLNKLKVGSGSSVLAGSNDGATKSAKKSTNGCVSGSLDERDRASSDSAEIVGSSNLQDRKSSSSPSGPQRRKIRKVRLLTDLLFDSGEAKAEQQVRKDVSPLRVVNSESTGAVMVSAPEGQTSFPDNGKVDSDDNKKRKLPQDGGKRSPEINLNKKVKSFKESEGNNDTSALPESEIKGDASTGLNPQTHRKTQWSKFGGDKLAVAERKKNKKSQSTDVHSYLVPIRENFPNQGLDEVGTSNKSNAQDGISFGVVNEATTSRGMGKIPLAEPIMEKKPSMSKNKSKMPLVDDGMSSQYHWNNVGFPKNSPITRNEEVIMQTGSIPVPFRQAEDASIDTGLQLSLGSSVAPRKCNRKYTPQAREDGISPLPSWQEGTPPVDKTMTKIVERNYVSEPTVASKPGSYSIFKKRVHGNVNGQLITYNSPAMNEKQTSNSQIEVRRSLGKQVDTSGTSNFLKTTKLKEHSAVSRKRSVKIAEKVSDKGAAEEFPMDIVELLARIQYEKGLQFSESSRSLLKAANEGRDGPMLDYDKVYNTEKFRIPEESSKRTNPQSRNGRSGINPGRKSVKPTKQKSVVEHFPNVNGDHANKSSHSVQKKSSSGIQISASGSECSCAQICRWNASMVGNGFFNASVQRGACNSCPIVPRPTQEAAQIWPSAIPLERPTRYNASQNGAPQRSNLQIVSSPPGLPQKGDYLNVNRDQDIKFSKHYATNLEIPGQHMVSETFSRRNPEHTYVNKHNGVEHQQSLRGSLDLYSNEAMPAMHLLSLVTAGMSSGPTFNTADNNSNEHPQMLVGVYNNNPKDSAVKHPLDYHGKSQLSVKPHDFFPINPGAGASTSSFRREKGFERANDFMGGQVSFGSRGKEKVQKSSVAPLQIRGKALSSAFTSGGYAPSHNPISAHGTIQKGFFGASSSSVVPLLQPHTGEYGTELKLGTPHATGAFRPLKSRPEFMVCSVNRNPADFSIPGAENKYMIRGEDLKVEKSKKRRGSTTAADQQQRKQQKHGKRIAETEHF